MGWHVLDGFETWHDTGKMGSERADEVYPFVESWLESHGTEDDWYLHVNFWDPHQDYDTPSSFGNPFSNDPPPDWPTADVIEDQYRSYGPNSARDLDAWGEGPRTERTPAKIGSREDFNEWIDGYDVGIRYMDEYIGKIVDKLETLGIFEQTLIVLSADHGEMQGELNVYGDHKCADDKTCRVPLVFHGPSVEPGITSEFYYQLDVGPTLVDIADGEPSSRWDGKSFAPAVTAGDEVGRDRLVLSQAAWTCQRGIRWGSWLLLVTYHDAYKGDLEDVMLFDLTEDPHEANNLADRRPAVVDEGLATLQRWIDNRLTEIAQDENGGNSDSLNPMTDPLWEVMHEGGPYHPTGAGDEAGDIESFIQRLRETGREHHADAVREQYHRDS